MNIPAALAAMRAMPCDRQHLEQVTGLSPVAVRRLVIQMRRELGMQIEWIGKAGYVIRDWGILDSKKFMKFDNKKEKATLNMVSNSEG